MEELQAILLVSWGVVTAILIALVIYRATLSSKEDDQIFIDAAEQHHFREQQMNIVKMERLTRPIMALATTSVVLLLTSLGVWLYMGWKSS